MYFRNNLYKTLASVSVDNVTTTISKGLRIVKVGKKEIIYLTLMGCAAVFSFIRTMVYGVLISPTEMGYYSIAITIASYGVFINLGLMSGMNRELPVCLGKKQYDYYAGLVGETTLTVIFLQLIGTMCFFTVLLNVSFSDMGVRTALFLASPLVLFGSLSQIVMLRLRSEQRVLSFSLLQLINSLAILLIGVLAIHFMSYKGIIFATILVNFLCFLIASKKMLNSPNYRYFNFNEIRYLMRIGIPLTISGALLNLQYSLDRLFLFKKVSLEEIGIYQVGIMPLTMGLIISSILNQYIGPRLLFRYGQGESLAYIYKRNLLMSMMTIVLMLIALPVFLVVVRFTINVWLSNYKECIPLISIFYIGAIFTAARFGVVLNAVNRQILSLYTTIFTLCFCFIGYLFVSHYQLSIKWYAYVNASGQIMSFFLIMGISYYLVKKSYKSEQVFGNSIKVIV